MNMQFIRRAFGSPKFFYAIVALLVLQAGWIALTARYPQAFDENYHLGLIQLHAQQWLPFFTSQPAGEALYGALARDPSYMYHFLFSLPYRLLEQMTDSMAAQMIIMRLMNVAIFVAGLFVYRRVLSELSISKILSNVILLFFVLTPVVPLLAGQLNYDNLMFLVTGILFLLMIRFVVALRAGQGQKLPLLGLQILAIGSFGSLVKFPFAPIFAASLVVLAVLTWRMLPRKQFVSLKLAELGNRTRLIIFSLLAVVMLGLCIERYGVNLVRYQSPVPKCDKVLSVEACLAYSPWARDYMYAATYPRPTAHGMAVYPGVWVYRMVLESMFTVTSTYWEDTSDNTTKVYYYAYKPLPVANITAWTVFIAGTLAAAWHWRRIWRNTALSALLAVIVFYTVVLFVQNFAMYRHSGEAVAIHGRYLVPVFPIIYAALLLGLVWAAQRFKLMQKAKVWILLIVFVLFMQGGGITVWLVRSQPWWFWSQSQPTQTINRVAGDILRKVIVH